ncbi:MAG: pyruvate dehydrogenase (acetyl-transferring) E1 component subunit alpha [Gammaproteobacteria bacterium]|nr:pyruvate dehydrogenase (acetyl-transferring) E1 component subunit alpha [Gammaproteobacteria bacterium]
MSQQKSSATFQIQHTQFLNPSGEAIAGPLPSWAKDGEVLIPLYRNMVQTRTFDAKAINLQRTGKLGTYASPLGQEAIGVGVASAMIDEDVMLPTYREYSAQLWRGVTMTELLLYWGGDERGSDFAVPRQDFPMCVPIATHTSHAVGVAYAMKLRKQKRIAVCFLGDGATSKGDFYESINAAGVWQLPILFVVANNQWAISVPRSRQTAAQTLAQKGIAAGIKCEQVDGNDIIAVRHVAQQAINDARGGGGPHLIEALTYRLSDHTTADDASRYRDKQEVEAQWQYDPVPRLRNYLIGLEAWSDEQEQSLLAECSASVDAAVREYSDTAAVAPQAMFDHLYEELPDVMAWQRQLAAASGGADE